MIKKNLHFIIGFLIISGFLCSCSVVFDAGVGGRVYYVKNGSETGISNAKVYVYSSASSSEPLASTRTDTNGNFTVSKIVWETDKGKFGKTADLHTVYIKVVHEDFEMTEPYITATLISDSSNAGMADVEMRQVRFTVPSFGGRIVSSGADDIPVSGDYDEITVYLCYEKDDGSYGFFDDYQESSVNTFASQSGTDAHPFYTHGNFTNLGGGNMKLKDISDVYVWADMNSDKVINTSDLIAGPYPIDKGKNSYTLKGSDFTPLP